MRRRKSHISLVWLTQAEGFSKIRLTTFRCTARGSFSAASTFLISPRALEYGVSASLASCTFILVTSEFVALGWTINHYFS